MSFGSFGYTEQELENMRKVRSDAYQNITDKIKFMGDDVLLNVSSMVDSIHEATKIRYDFSDTSDDDGFGGSSRRGRSWGK
jgi:hypothetical protein